MTSVAGAWCYWMTDQTPTKLVWTTFCDHKIFPCVEKQTQLMFGVPYWFVLPIKLQITLIKRFRSQMAALSAAAAMPICHRYEMTCINGSLWLGVTSLDGGSVYKTRSKVGVYFTSSRELVHAKIYFYRSSHRPIDFLFISGHGDVDRVVI